jgi:hypothetical protein
MRVSLQKVAEADEFKVRAALDTTTERAERKKLRKS